MHRLIAPVIAGFAATVATLAWAVAQTPTAPRFAPPGTDEHAQIQLARDLDQQCPTFTYFEQRFMERAADERLRNSHQQLALVGLADPQRRQVQAEWRTKRREQARQLGCGWDGAAAMAKGVQYAYLDLTASLLLAVHFRMGEQVNPALGPLTQEERALVASAVDAAKKKYEASFANLEAAAQVLAMQRVSEQGMMAESMRQSSMFTTLRFQAAANTAGYAPRLLLFDQQNGPPLQLIEMKPNGDKPKLFVVSGPERVMIPRRAGGNTPAYLVTLREPSGALLVGLYGEDVKTLKDLPLRAVLLEAGGPREGARVTGAECMFEMCFRYSASTMQAVTAVSSYDRYKSLITERSSYDNPTNARDRQTIFRDLVVLAGAQTAPASAQR